MIFDENLLDTVSTNIYDKNPKWMITHFFVNDHIHNNHNYLLLLHEALVKKMEYYHNKSKG